MLFELLWLVIWLTLIIKVMPPLIGECLIFLYKYIEDEDREND